MDSHKLQTDQEGQPQDFFKLRGCYELALLGPNQEVLDYRKVDNVVVTIGRSYVLSMIQSVSPSTTPFTFIGVGTSTTGPATGDLILGSEALRISISSYVTGGLG